MEKKIIELIEDTIESSGYELVKVSLNGTLTKTLEVMIERKDGKGIEVGDCQSVSKNISAILDVEDIIPGKYFLEVSSAGIERPLVKPEDFQRYKDREIKIRLKKAHNGSLSFRGKLLGMENLDKIILKSEKNELIFDFDNIKSAKLVFTDEMFRKLLNKKKINQES